VLLLLSITINVNIAKLGSKARNLLSEREGGERVIKVSLGPNLEQSQGISYLEREMG
jgi:hypothetical protein